MILKYKLNIKSPFEIVSIKLKKIFFKNERANAINLVNIIQKLANHNLHFLHNL